MSAKSNHLQVSNDSASPRDLWLAMDEAALAALCIRQTFRGSGPGGQHRNTTSSGVRMVHQPTELCGQATQGRSQVDNIRAALMSLRWTIAIEIRLPLNGDSTVLLQHRTGDRLTQITRQAAPQLAAVVLDALADTGFVVNAAASNLGVSSSQLAGFITDHPPLLTAANRGRESHQLRPLTAPGRRGSR